MCASNYNFAHHILDNGDSANHMHTARHHQHCHPDNMRGLHQQMRHDVRRLLRVNQPLANLFRTFVFT